MIDIFWWIFYFQLCFYLFIRFELKILFKRIKSIIIQTNDLWVNLDPFWTLYKCTFNVEILAWAMFLCLKFVLYQKLDRDERDDVTRRGWEWPSLFYSWCSIVHDGPRRVIFPQHAWLHEHINRNKFVMLGEASLSFVLLWHL